MIYITWGRERAARPLMDEGTSAPHAGAERHIPCPSSAIRQKFQSIVKPIPNRFVRMQCAKIVLGIPNSSIFLSIHQAHASAMSRPGNAAQPIPHNFAKTVTEMSGIFTQEPAGDLVAKLDSLRLIRFSTIQVTQSHKRGVIKGRKVWCLLRLRSGYVISLGRESVTASLIRLNGM